MEYKEKNILKIFQSFLYVYTYQTLYCLSDVLGKKYLNLYMDGLYLFLFKVGIIGLLLLATYELIAYYFIFDKYSTIIKCFYDLKDSIWIFLFNLSCYFFFEVSLWLTIYYFSPCHYIILEALGNFSEILLNMRKDYYTKTQLKTFLVLYPIIYFATLVFNEIIILNFWGLSFNTELYIAERGEGSKSSYTDSDIHVNNEGNDDDNDDDDDTDKSID
jgi:hypothetical protein